MRTGFWMAGLTVCLVLACTHRPTDAEMSAQRLAENEEVNRLFQGIWLDDESESVQFWAKGDTLYYPDAAYEPLLFRLTQDTLFIYGAGDSTAYRIDQLDACQLSFHSLSDEVVRLHKSDNALDSLAFQYEYTEAPTPVVQKDSVISYGGHRYRGYAYINPSKMKVLKTTYTETGMGVENIYYDNVIHICVYEGRKRLYAKDFQKKDFAALLPADFLRQAILSDMDFVRADGEGFKYQASLCIPEEASCYSVDIFISHAGELSLRSSVFH